jgi:hypothetical protein
MSRRTPEQQRMRRHLGQATRHGAWCALCGAAAMHGQALEWLDAPHAPGRVRAPGSASIRPWRCAPRLGGGLFLGDVLLHLGDDAVIVAGLFCSPVRARLGSFPRPARHGRLGRVIARCAPVPCEASAMPDEYRVTIRLSPELYAQLTAHGRHGQPVAAIVRQALAEYLARQPAAPESPADLAITVAAMAARLEGLQEQVDALTAQVDTLAASRPPVAASPRQPMADVAADTPARHQGRRPGPMRQQILELLQARRPIGDTLQGLQRAGLIIGQGRGVQRRYVVPEEP